MSSLFLNKTLLPSVRSVEISRVIIILLLFRVGVVLFVIVWSLFVHFYVVNVLYVPYCTCDSFCSRVKVFSGLIIRKCLVSLCNKCCNYCRVFSMCYFKNFTRYTCSYLIITLQVLWSDEKSYWSTWFVRWKYENYGNDENWFETEQTVTDKKPHFWSTQHQRVAYV